MNHDVPGRGGAAFSEARLRPSDIDMAELYDAVAISTSLFLEDLGFVKNGEAGCFVGAGGISPGGRRPVNTNGGGLYFCQPGVYEIFLTTEAARQLRGEARAAQVKGAHRALIHGNGCVMSVQATVILGERAVWSLILGPFAVPDKSELS